MYFAVTIAGVLRKPACPGTLSRLYLHDPLLYLVRSLTIASSITLLQLGDA